MKAGLVWTAGSAGHSVGVHLSEICRNWKIPSQESFYHFEDRCETPFVFTLPISLERRTRTSGFLDRITFFACHICLFSLVVLERLPLGSSNREDAEEQSVQHDTLSMLTQQTTGALADKAQSVASRALATSINRGKVA